MIIQHLAAVIVTVFCFGINTLHSYSHSIAEDSRMYELIERCKQCRSVNSNLNVCGPLSVGGLLTAASLAITGSSTFSGPISVAGAANFAGDVTGAGTATFAGDINGSGNGNFSGSVSAANVMSGGTPVLTSLNSWGTAYATGTQTASGNVMFTAGMPNNGVSVSGGNVVLANPGTYLINYGAQFTTTTPIPAGSPNVTPNLNLKVNGFDLPVSYPSSVAFSAPSAGGDLPAGSTAGVSGSVIVQTNTPNAILTMPVSLPSGVSLASVTFPASNAMINAIQLD